MKRILLFTFILLLALTTKAQQLSYAYDAAGNRVSRTIVLATRSATIAQQDSVFFEEQLAEKQIQIYPNPVESELTVTVTGYNKAIKGEIALYNMTGSMLVRKQISDETTRIDMSRYIRGNYVLHIILNGKTSTWKIIKE